MGYIRHHAIVVTGWQKDAVVLAHETAVGMGNSVTPVVPSPVNGYFTFLVIPDGSKEGWPGSEAGDQARRKFVEWLEAGWHEDRWLDWVEVSYGGDEPEGAHVARQAFVVSHSVGEPESEES